MISEKIKKEQTLDTEIEDPYFDIKKELQDLDYCDNVITHDLTNEDEIKTDKDLLRILVN